MRRVTRRALGIDGTSRTDRVAYLHDNEPERPPLDAAEIRDLTRIRRFGAVGAGMMALGALGAGAQPVLQNPVQGVRVLGLFARALPAALTVTLIGTVLVVVAWLLLGRLAIGSFGRGTSPRRLSRSQLDRTLALWILPLCVAPPMFSKDVYSYLAQSEITARGLDPYEIGPQAALGVDHVLTRTVPNIWRETPAPYGPFFLWIGRGITALTGDDIVSGIFLHRAVALVGVALIVWALPRLAARCGVSSVAALWLGAANPLLLFHLVAGIHNEALMLGLMLAGLELCFRGIDALDDVTRRRTGRALLLVGAAVIALSATVKIPSLIALGFVGMALARRRGGRLRDVVRAAVVLGVVAAVVIVGVSLVSGLGFGWLGTLGTANAVRSWMSLPTLLGLATGGAGVLLGIGDHTTAVLSLTRPIASAVAAVVIARMLVATLLGRLHPIGGLGVSIGALVLLFPVVQPWYLLWAVTPLAAWATRPAFRVPVIAFSAFVSLIVMPTGGEVQPFVIVQAALATVVTLGVVYAATRRSLPWRARTTTSDGAGTPPPQADAYAGPS
ncbi:polyprenol phosphomannose-dependent alpha 1,6 mannosyltransferase MptB [Rhodococcus kroppenstedtii]|uniref:Polyprenol phosphomannose-dependent alpha 1,6 mannosyltransferase MptB n=1 Tax=Rhodococcoides kroppenstedtii TaxID=293050 RepID=A0ABS7NP15_9NOCA|nr:polyprenol phosphomannose-dependent alpha 1,6 mannosyltransferase MptB [Rhodococcus kroppenstedtii]MBY6319388.1 polyprenol phosphomannose-dependent alpha 1,6 mannosyltransferase MptB [Rhodococcus kroppenstedtii]MBY6398071.1 polyprenol phosphomannose-dependent alpha 1,6 mannosyltransferase MptB [Rhodococcus kroppenstedtii]